ncbi:D-glycero-beta-D-manno-heptose-7-phosphate kinase [soil metagenome]
MNKNSLEKIFNKAASKKIYIVGDVILDRYFIGKVNRISPEAPVQVFDIEETQYKLGGAANVCLNINTLGSKPVLIGIIGDDAHGSVLESVLESQNIPLKGIIKESDRKTSCKTRVIADAHHLIRLDSETKKDITKDSENKILELLNENKNEIEVLILQDYNKGVLTKNLIKKIIEFANKSEIKVLTDPKFENFFEYKSVFLFKPNKKEFEDAAGRKFRNMDDLISSAHSLMKKIGCKNLLLTLGEHGMMIFENKNGKITEHSVKTKARKVSDVSGAGDTVISTMAVSIAGGAKIKDAAVLANQAAGIVVEESGIVPIQKEKLIEAMLQK